MLVQDSHLLWPAEMAHSLLSEHSSSQKALPVNTVSFTGSIKEGRKVACFLLTKN